MVHNVAREEKRKNTFYSVVVISNQIEIHSHSTNTKIRAAISIKAIEML